MNRIISGNGFLLACLLFLVTIIRASGQTAQFSADKISGCFPVTVNFTDASSGSVNSWSWNFGNGNTSVLQNPSAVYTQPGTYTVSLTVSNGSGSDSEVKTGFIVVHGYPVVDFSFNKNSGCSPLQVQFTNLVSGASGAITSYQWIFGDGGTSAQANPAYTYQQPGTPSIALKATNIHGCEATFTKQSAVQVFGPSVNFTASATTLCQVPSLISFTNQSTGDGTLSYHWNFGDGSTSTQKDPSHTFTIGGAYTVRLTTTDGNGCSSFHDVQINAGTEDGLTFIPSSEVLCVGQLLSFSVQSTKPIVSMNWNFGNGTSSTSSNPLVSFQTPGNYTITLAAQLQDKTCQSIFTRNVTVVANAQPSFTSNLSCSNALTLTSTTTGAQRLEWSVNNNVISIATSFIYNPLVENVEITLTAFNSKNCPAVVKRIISIPQSPRASFDPLLEQDCKLPSLSGCAPFTVNFTNTSTAGSDFTSSWILGEGVTSTTKNPTRTFANAGTFSIRLVITDARGCKDSIQSTVRVASAPPTVTFTMDKNEVCSGETISFTSTSTNADLLCWDFGDGTVITGKNVAYKYSKPGVYKVKVTAKNAGCITVFESPQQITVKDPMVNFTYRKSCEDPYLVEFEDKSENADAVTWTLGDGNAMTTRNFSHRFASTGNYEVILTGTNNTTHCSVSSAGIISIQDIKADFILDTETPCKNNPTQTTDRSEFAASWAWYIDNQLTIQTKNPVFTFQTAGIHKIKLNAYDTDGCVDSKEITIQVPNITGNFSFSASSDCENFSVQFNDASFGSPAIQNWHWDFGDGTTSDERNPLHIFHERDSFDISLKLTNPEGNCTFVHKDAVIFSVPIVDFNAYKTTHCLDETVRFSNTTTNASIFLWEFEDAGESVLFTPTTSYDVAGSYDVTLSATDRFGCTLSLTRPDHIVVAQPKADFQAFQTSGECPPLTSIFKSTSTGSNLTYMWDFGNSTLSMVKDPACTYTRPGTYDVALRIRDQFGCTDSKIVNDLIHVRGPFGTFEQTTVSICSDATVDFQSSATNTIIYEWDFGDGVVVHMNRDEVNHRYSRSGTYNPSLVLIDDKNCKVVAEGGKPIVVHDSTAVEFTFSPVCIFDGEPLSLSASNHDNATHQWLINDVSIGEGIETSVVLDSAAIFDVELRGVNEFGCVSSSKQKIQIHGKISWIPNVFTGNGDAYNETFVIPGVEKSEWTLSIFNRWGREIFLGRNYLNTWSADDLAAGTYYYYLNNQVCPDRTYKGYIHVLK